MPIEVTFLLTMLWCKSLDKDGEVQGSSSSQELKNDGRRTLRLKGLKRVQSLPKDTLDT